jgi:hypothetical protein
LVSVPELGNQSERQRRIRCRAAQIDPQLPAQNAVDRGA